MNARPQIPEHEYLDRAARAAGLYPFSKACRKTHGSRRRHSASSDSTSSPTIPRKDARSRNRAVRPQNSIAWPGSHTTRPSWIQGAPSRSTNSTKSKRRRPPESSPITWRSRTWRIIRRPWAHQVSASGSSPTREDSPPIAIMRGPWVKRPGTGATELASQLARRGLQVPRDVSLIGFDDWQISLPGGIGLTSFRQDFERMAHMAVTLLMERIDRPDLPARLVECEGALVNRDSVENI